MTWFRLVFFDKLVQQSLGKTCYKRLINLKWR